MEFESIKPIISICPDCKDTKGGVYMQYIGYKTTDLKFHIYFACNVCLYHFEYILNGPVRLKDKPV